ncbi:granzyme H-like isoform X3 [Equus caballus]|uniref:granzyme H-like isoform X3 n=1 Tax=Equus caballus TaxID=9796 RepID=UPI000C9DAE25|nr:granzyme H-like isoform X2 [Equus caballus]
MQPLLLLLAFLLAHEAGTEDIIGGHEAKPHSHPYKALVQFLLKDQKNRCSSVLLRKDFVLTAAHCWGSPIMVTLGTHNIQEQERTQQVIPVREAICHPDYNPKNFVNDIMLLKGDSWGPLICENMAQSICSYGQKNGTPPAVFMKVSHYLPWIKRTMKCFSQQVSC